MELAKSLAAHLPGLLVTVRIGTHFSHLNEFKKIIFSYTLETTTLGAFDLLYYFVHFIPFTLVAS